MKNFKRTSKTVNVLTSVLELLCEIVLLPFHVIKTILYIIAEING